MSDINREEGKLKNLRNKVATTIDGLIRMSVDPSRIDQHTIRGDSTFHFYSDDRLEEYLSLMHGAISNYILSGDQANLLRLVDQPIAEHAQSYWRENYEGRFNHQFFHLNSLIIPFKTQKERIEHLLKLREAATQKNSLERISLLNDAINSQYYETTLYARDTPPQIFLPNESALNYFSDVPIRYSMQWSA